MEGIFQEESFEKLMAVGIFIMLALALAFVVFVNYSQKKILKEQMHVQQLNFQHQEELLHATILTQEAERQRIARDLHDEIGSKLNVIFLNICRLKPYGETNDEIDVITSEVESVIHTTIESVRFISHELLPPTLEEFGLIEAIRELQHSFNILGKIHINFTIMSDQSAIDNSLIELNLFRVIQELINNSIKHGKASGIEMKIWTETDHIKFFYQDNGSGFDIDKMEEKKGLGMKNIESRLRILKGTSQYTSSLGKGTSVVIEIVPSALHKI